MAKIIFFILPLVVSNFFEKYLSLDNSNLMNLKYFQIINDEYLVIFINSKNQTYYGRVNSTYYGTVN